MEFKLEERYIVLPRKEVESAGSTALKAMDVVLESIMEQRRATKRPISGRKYVCISDKYEDDYLDAVKIVRRRTISHMFKLGHPIWVRDSIAQKWVVVIYGGMDKDQYLDHEGRPWVYAEHYTPNPPSITNQK